MRYSLKSTCALLVLVGTVCISRPCQAIDFTYSFVNNAGFNTVNNAIVSGRIFGLLDNSQNFSTTHIKVTFDSVSTGFGAGFSAATWLDVTGQFTVNNGVLSFVAFNQVGATETIDLHDNTGGRGLINLNNFSAFYRNFNGTTGTPDITFSRIADAPAVPDSTYTLGLLVTGIIGLECFRRRNRARVSV